ncbi:hypothetical protein [Vibrio alfacsensis]|uniref:hypothetical protein n=2 Tax=Vibrio TaxID=662 RepID=UPI00078C408C|nr:hypothetical protein [Vibrio alfacsensis]BAU71048.1 hypothetical protein [Vibrio sp. 04Ya108]BBM67692.1 hypothetical protein VA249_43380 [Vibrio alfacsensis]BCN27189.1 hypothetical protein VYA_43810 [Vibrio alfacsensis]
MDIETSDSQVTVTTLEVDGKKLTKLALSNLGIVDFTDIYDGARTGRYRFISRFPIEIFAKLALAKEKILPITLSLPTDEDLSDTNIEVSGVVLLDTKNNALMTGWFCDRYLHGETLQAEHRRDIFKSLIELTDSEILHELKRSPSKYYTLTYSDDLKVLLNLCSILELNEWHYDVGGATMSNQQCDDWWNGLDKSDPENDQWGSYDNLPNLDWINQKIESMWKENKNLYRFDIASDEAEYSVESANNAVKDIKVHSQYLSSPWIYL